MAKVRLYRARDNGWLKIDFGVGFSSSQTIEFEYLEKFGGKELAEQARAMAPGDEIDLNMRLTPTALEIGKQTILGVVKKINR